MPVSNTYLQPEDGWKVVVTGPAFIRMSVVPETHPFYVYKGSIVPDATVGGLLYTQAYVENAVDGETFYVRVVSPGPDEPVRVDTFWIAGGVIAASRLSLEDDSGFLALEDGTGVILLES